MDIKIQKDEDIIQTYVNQSQQNKFYLFGDVHFNYLVLLHGGHIDLNFTTTGTNVSANIFCVCFGDGDSVANIQTDILHNHADINVFMLSFLQDDNYISVNGNISIKKGINESQGHLLQKNLILGKNIKIKAQPRLDVYSKNIKATHGVGIDRFDPEKIFYLSSKGLSKKDSSHLIISGYLQYVLQHFPDPKNSHRDIEKTILSTIKIND